LTSLIDRADRTLYRAKRFGRNRIEQEASLDEMVKNGDSGSVIKN